MNHWQSFLTNIKVAWLWAITTASTSLGSLFDLIPDTVGKLGVVMTVAISFVLLRVHLATLRNKKIEAEIKTLELEKLKRELGDNAA